jgi:hypothetical protein
MVSIYMEPISVKIGGIDYCLTLRSLRYVIKQPVINHSQNYSNTRYEYQNYYNNHHQNDYNYPLFIEIGS